MEINNYPLICWWNGEIVVNGEDISYKGGSERFVIVNNHISLSELKSEIYDSLEVDRTKFELNIKMKFPSVRGYKVLSLSNDRSLKAMWASVCQSKAASMDLFIELTSSVLEEVNAKKLVTTGPAPAINNITFPFQTSTTHTSSLSPSSSVSVPASTAAPGFPDQSATSVSVPASTSALSFSGPGSTSSALGSSFTSPSLPTSSSFIFGVTSQSRKPTPIIAPSPTLPGFSFGQGSSGAASSAPLFGATSTTTVFGATSSTPVFGGTSSALAFGATSSAPAFGVTTSTASASNGTPFVFGGNSGLAASAPVFGAPISAPSGGFAFNATPAPASPFQFNIQPSQVTPSNPFQPSARSEFNGGTGSFSSGTSDNSQRRIVRVKKGAKKR